jgi:hypothetical protein
MSRETVLIFVGTALEAYFADGERGAQDQPVTDGQRRRVPPPNLSRGPANVVFQKVTGE